MKKVLLTIAFTVALVAGCQPKPYLGILDTPIGNWKSSESHYYFAGKEVFQDDSCQYSAISFYKDSLCCIEGMKGAFKWYHTNDSLVVDSIIWRVTALTGARLALDYLGRIPDIHTDIKTETTPNTASSDDYEDSDLRQFPIVYLGISIESDGRECWYIKSDGTKVLCWEKTKSTEDGKKETVCWWDFRTDYYIPF